MARAGGFARAAVELGVTPSAVSQSIRRLEARLGIRLLARTTRSVALTQEGEALLLEVGPTLERLATAERVLSDGRGKHAGRARLSVPVVAMELLVSPVLAEFRQAYPEFQLEIIVEDKLTDPVAQCYDAVIRRGDLLHQDMVARRLSEDDRLILVASGAWADRRMPRHPRDLGVDRIVIRRPRSGAILPWNLECPDEAVTLKGESALVTESAISARQYALAGLGVARLAQQFSPACYTKVRCGGFCRNGVRRSQGSI